MNTRLLGDAADHWKGSLLGFLQQAGLLCQLAVDPMVSDALNWTAEDYMVYTRLLRVESAQLTGHKTDLKADRAGYFTEISHTGDLFLDPDSGMATGKPTQVERYVMPEEVGALLAANRDRLLIFCQRGPFGVQISNRVENLLDAPRRRSGNFHWCAYGTANQVMLFISGQKFRIAMIANHLRDVLGSRAAGRILSGEK